ncbi:hypothetical protein [Halalkalibacter alkaliphilus]|uniref:Uncharacterized protein n=1 Tax=Halalkalibacter alkaliphilus TaxID=2917993 RepID=A0A9X2CRG2_9BACI|nr:hypothetical protein [Halalkalibacter alkaliphilus]MCL7746054.1 hypothetical protein [Halalkalibacter alkaliphilus]
MEHQPLTYFEKLENLYVLMETKKMLQAKLEQVKQENQPTNLIEEDLRKIEEEIAEYTDGSDMPDPNITITSSLFNPAIMEEMEGTDS